MVGGVLLLEPSFPLLALVQNLYFIHLEIIHNIIIITIHSVQKYLYTVQKYTLLPSCNDFCFNQELYKHTH